VVGCSTGNNVKVLRVCIAVSYKIDVNELFSFTIQRVQSLARLMSSIMRKSKLNKNISSLSSILPLISNPSNPDEH
jgi:hypothetical protein